MFQRFLVVFQFVVSVTLIICTIAVYQQMNFILNKEIGLDKEQVMVIKGTNALSDKLPVFKERIQQLGAVTNLSVSDYLPIEGSRRYADSFWEEGKQKLEEGVNAQIWQVDPGYINTLGISLLKGRDFREDFSADSSSVILSRSLAQKLALKEEPGGIITNKEKTWNVIGVFDDFHFESFKNEISPMCLVLGDSPAMMAVKLNTTNSVSTIDAIKNTWSELVPMNPFRYEFLDDNFAAMHLDVRRSARLFNVFALLAIIIACLGLFGLTAFNTDQRKKELGIRKVLGATATNILVLLSRDFIILVFVAVIFAIPLGSYIVNNWLESFAYRIDLHWLVFIAAASLTLLIALLSVSAQCIKVALANPVKSIQEI